MTASARARGGAASGGVGVGERFRIDRAFFRDRREVDADVERSGFAAVPFTSKASEAELPLHFHADDIVTYVLRGSATFVTAEGERVRARKGDRIVIPARAVHAEGAVHEETEYLVSARLKPEHNGRLRLGEVLC